MSPKLPQGCVQSDNLVRHGKKASLGRRTSHSLVAVFLVVCAVITVRGASAQSTQARSLIDRYLSAAQKRDYLTLAKCTRELKGEELLIRELNPRTLWNSLLAEYWKQKANDLEHKEVKKDRIGEMEFAPVGEDGAIYETRELLALITPKVRWTVTEIRPRPRAALSAVYYLDVFLELSYPSPADAAHVGDKALRKTTLGCVVDGPMMDSVGGCSRFEKSDVYWSVPR